MATAWAVTAAIRFVSNGATVMGGLSRQAGLVNARLAAQQGQITRTQLAAQRYQASMRAIQASQIAMGTRVASVGFGVGAAAIIDAASSAGKLQQAMVGIRNATGASNSQMEKLRQTAFDVSDATAQSVVQSANVMKLVGKGLTAPQLVQIAKPAAMFADVQFLSNRVSFEGAAKQANQLAHLFQRFNGPGMTKMFDAATRVSMMMPDNLDAFIKQAGYYMPAFKKFGVSDDQSFVAGAFLDQMGLGRGKGGSGLQNFVMQQMQALALTGHVQAGRRAALRDLGLINRDNSSRFYTVNRQRYGDDAAHFDLFGSLRAINDAVIRSTKGLKGHQLELASARMITEIQSGLGVTGGRIGFLGSTQSLARLNAMLKQLPTLPDTATAQANYMGALPGQFQRAVSNFQSVMTELGYPWLTDLGNMFRGIGDSLHNLQSWMHQHRAAEKAIGGAVAALTAFLGGRALMGVLGLVGRISGGVTGGAGGIGGFFKMLDAFFAGGLVARLLSGALAIGRFLIFVNPWIGGIVLAIGGLYALYQVFTHLPDILRTVNNWWVKWQGPVAYTIGYAMETILRWLTLGIVNLGDMAGQMVIRTLSALKSTIGKDALMMFVNPAAGSTQFAIDFAKANSAALKGINVGPKDFFGKEFNRGSFAGDQGHSFQPFSVQVDARGATDPKAVGDHVGRAIVNALSSATHSHRTSGRVSVSPAVQPPVFGMGLGFGS